MKLSIIIPCYNEMETLPKILDKVEKVKLKNKIKKEIILIDDFSSDGTREYIKNLPNRFVKILHKKNRGKGGAVKSGILQATGEIIIIQDADLEYDPGDYNKVIYPILSGKADVVYGSRSLKKDNAYSHLTFLLGGKLVTLVTNILFFSRLTDEPTCYKVFKSDIIKKIKINGEKFDWEPEITAKILKRGIKIREVPISYYPRKKDEGKKINWKDGIHAIWTLVKYRFKE
ncbi:glycosyl transferase [Candidatus Pacearchaeota archaeon CG1_02_32_132]|nr:MAG: glycosyl transferase [Candidatus Pacearchaeota archaeon CG1_02_32_132]